MPAIIIPVECIDKKMNNTTKIRKCLYFSPLGRVPSPSVNQLPNSDIEAMIQSVSNIPDGTVGSSVQSVATQRSKYCCSIV